MNFDIDAFISYAHLDNVELVEGQKGWVANLHRALEVRLGQLLGKQPQIWRDPKLSGNDFFADTLVQRLQDVAALVSVVSPPYIRSEWARRELNAFWRAAEQQGGVRFHDKARLFKILKSPVPLEMLPPELRSVLGYEFFTVHPETGRIRELNEVFGPDAQREFWIKLDDLAHDLCSLLEEVQESESSTTHSVAVFLAETTTDLKEQREAIKRDLLQHGYTVLPSTALSMVSSDLKAAVRADLARCEMSIHFVGKNYSVVPEGDAESLVEIQNELAIERSAQGNFSRLLWIPAGLEIQDERQQKVIERLRMDQRIQAGADLLETSLEDLKTVYQERLKRRVSDVAPQRDTVIPTPKKGRQLVYFVYEQRDANFVGPWIDFLFKQGLEVVCPMFEGDEAETREFHEENLRNCDAVFILYGKAGELWLRRKIREVQKSVGYGRTKPAPLLAVCLAPPKTMEKENFRTHEALVIPQMEGFSSDLLQPFIVQLAS